MRILALGIESLNICRIGVCAGGGISLLSWKISLLLQSWTSRGWKKKGQERSGQHPHSRPSFTTYTTDLERGDCRSQHWIHIMLGGSKSDWHQWRDWDASWVQAEKIQAVGKWKKFHQNLLIWRRGPSLLLELLSFQLWLSILWMLQRYLYTKTPS